jgi:hypothetical protein
MNFEEYFVLMVYPILKSIMSQLYDIRITQKYKIWTWTYVKY